MTLNGRALLFAVAVSVLTGLLFGLAPALQMSDRRLVDKLSQGARGVGIASRQHRFLSALVASEFALSLVLMVGAGLLLRSFWKVLEVQPGFNSDHLVTAHFGCRYRMIPRTILIRPRRSGMFSSARSCGGLAPCRE